MSAKKFKDLSGKEWTPHITGDVVFKYEDRTGISLFKTIAENPLDAVPGFREVTILLYLSVEEEANAKNVSEEQLRKNLGGETLEEAGGALMESLFDFFPRLREFAEKFKSSLNLNFPDPVVGQEETSSNSRPVQE